MPPSNKYKALSDLMGDVKLSRAAKEAAEKAYFEVAGKKVP